MLKMMIGIVLSNFFLSWGCKKGYEEEYQRAYALVAKKDLDSMERAVKKFDHAIRYAIAALQGKYEALLGLGAKYMELKMYSEATKIFLEAAQIKSEDPLVYYFLGLSYANAAEVHLSQKERDTLIVFAEKAYQYGEKLDPEYLPLQYALGVFYGLVQDDILRGMEYLQKVLKKNPSHVESLFASGRLYTELGKLTEAWACYEKIENLYPGTDFAQKAKENLQKIRGALR